MTRGYGGQKMKNRGRSIIESLLGEAGVRVGGSEPRDIRVHDERFYQRVLGGASLGLGESYMDGWWDCAALDEFFYRVLGAKLDEKVKISKWLLWILLKAKIINFQKKSRAFLIGEKHYDLGNALYQNMLDERMIYSCGYWKDAKTLDEAQEAKLDLVCRKIGLKEGMKILDIGCGWGGFAKYAAEKYEARVVGVTVSKEQADLARRVCEGLPVEIRLQDYRDISEKFDGIVSIGMFEHVGYKNYQTYMKVARDCLKDNGLFLLHTIGRNVARAATDPWINKYIFPDSVIPSAEKIINAAKGLFALEDWHSFGADYDKTLMAWHQNFKNNWDKIKNIYDQRFYRMWSYYLLACAGSFRVRKNQLWQIVFSKNGVAGGYASVR